MGIRRKDIEGGIFALERRFLSKMPLMRISALPVKEKGS
jgi:hypothetical protein